MHQNLIKFVCYNQFQIIAVMQTQDLIYLNPIEQNIPRKEFQDIARARMNIYQFLDPHKQKFTQTQLDSLKTEKKSLTPEAQKLFDSIYNPWAYYNNDNQKKKDNLSHYICRLMFCLTPENKENYITYQTMIFKTRLFERVRANVNQQELFETLTKIASQNNYFVGDIKQISIQEFLDVQLQMYSACDRRHRFPKEAKPKERKVNRWQPKKLFKVPMEFCEFLVSKRDCYLHKGEAYLYGDLFVKILPKIYAKYLRLAMQDLEKNVEDILNNDQNNQFRQFIRTEPSILFERKVSPQQLKQGLNLRNIGIMSRRSFPPCMIQMYDVLVTKKHLKHEARLQLMLFLKIAGLPLQDAQHLWKSNYTKGVSDSQSKEILYNVRHSYGQEGKKADYSGKDCHKIINSKPSSNQYHGCPFKYYGNEELIRFLKAKYPNALNQPFFDEILAKKSKNQFEVACRNLFEKLHPDPKDKHLNASQGVGRHPNSYFYRSEKYYELLSGNQK